MDTEFIATGDVLAKLQLNSDVNLLELMNNLCQILESIAVLQRKV